MSISHPIPEDRRYEVAPEHCGHETPRLVLRFAGAFVASSASYVEMTDKAREHRAERMEAL